MGETLAKCPECGGEGGHVYQTADGDWDGEQCDTCRGSGKVKEIDDRRRKDTDE